ncbi:hypothetical protein KEJ27_10350, partial [Candidatus Bathyarchaeota archaeon]|nr:hypothetical protein [Candidatus Bathyarchaeota archaeon]
MYSKQLDMYVLIALLALTPLLIAVPTRPVLAAVKEPVVSIDYPYMVVGEELATRTITVDNPMGNPDIVEVRMYVPAAAAEELQSVTIICPGFVDGTSFSVAGTGPWTITSKIPEGYDYILPDGATGKIVIDSIDPEDWEATGGVVDKFELTVVIKFKDGTSMTKSIYLYEGSAETVTVELSKDEIKAGESVDITVTVDPADKGVPLVIWAVDPDGNTVKIKEALTGSDGKAKTSYTPTKKGSWDFYADAAIDIGPVGAQLDVFPDTLGVLPGAPTKVVVETQFDEDGYDVSY